MFHFFKKIVLIGILIFVPLSTLSAAASLYIGPGVSFETRQSGDIRNISLRPRILAGIGATFNPWAYLAAEVFYDPKAINLSDDTVNGVDLKSTYDYGASIIPGIYLDNVILLYLRLGAVVTHFTYPDVTKTGGQAGAGLEVALMNCFSVRGEYDYVNYNRVTDIGTTRSNNYYLSFLYRFIL